MRFWIECTRFETGQATHINIALVGSMWRDGERTVLAFVGGDARASSRSPRRPSRSWPCISARWRRRDDAMTMRPDTDWSEASVDLRKVGAHPDYWYPVAWSREVKPGQTLRRAFRRRADRAGAARRRRGLRARRPLRAPAGAAVEGHGRWLHHPLRLSRLALRRVRRLRRRPLSRQGQAAERRAPLSLFRARRADLRLARHCARRRAAAAHRRRRPIPPTRRGGSARIVPATTRSCMRT